MYNFAGKYVVDDNACWLWQHYTLPGGYGQLGYLKKKWLAHRLSYTQTKGPIPDGLDLDHLCRVRNCINPDHLEPVTRGENNRRGKSLVTHCKLGHPYSGDNLYVNPKGARMCRTCQARKGREYAAANKARRNHASRLRRARMIEKELCNEDQDY